MLRAILAIIGTAAGLIFLLSFKTHSTSAVTTPPAAIGGTNSGSADGSTPGATSTPGAASTPGTSSPSSGTSGSGAGGGTSGSAATKTVTGAAADTMYGPVQVKITVKNGKLTAVDAVVYPQQDPRDAQINAYAVPALDREALAAGSAHIDAISGATYTSGGYISSLQSALDKAGI
jgi:uncharacterized protein with FMN-binding domain